MILSVFENTFDFIRINGNSNEKYMSFKFRGLKSDGIPDNICDIDGIEYPGGFKVIFSKMLSCNIIDMGVSFMINIEVSYNDLIWEYVNCKYFNTNCSSTNGHPEVFNQFINNPSVTCLTFSNTIKECEFNGIKYTPKQAYSPEVLEIIIDEGVNYVNLNEYDLRTTEQIIIEHIYTNSLQIDGLPDDFIESDKYDQELAINFRQGSRDKSRVQFRVGLVGDDPCMTKFIRKEISR